jgi:hypothetical protein
LRSSTGAVALVGACVAALCATGALGGGADPAAAGNDPARYLASDPAQHRVRLTLLAGLGTDNNGFNFDGYGRGRLLVRIPLGWRVVVDCENRGTMRHSCAIVQGSLSTRPAFPHAASPQPLAGLATGARATFTFRATRRGSFRIACLVPGHEQARMWDVLDVGGSRPAISARAGP